MIIIVSGLPRSGTSMMMRMLEKAGVSILTDNLRRPDKDNLLGYYEYEPVKYIRRDNSWFGEAEGKALKIVSPLLRNIPPEYRYRVVFMERRIEEVLASQERMLENRNTRNDISYEKMRELYENHLVEIKRWLHGQSNIKTLFVEYAEILDDPLTWAIKVEKFLDLKNVAQEMTKGVRPELYRQRK